MSETRISACARWYDSYSALVLRAASPASPSRLTATSTMDMSTSNMVKPRGGRIGLPIAAIPVAVVVRLQHRLPHQRGAHAAHHDLRVAWHREGKGKRGERGEATVGVIGDGVS